MSTEKTGRFIAELRKRKGLTQQELGEKMGIGYRSVSKWEQGITCPDISIIGKLASELGVTTDELLNGAYQRNINKPQEKPIDSSIVKVIKELNISISILNILLTILLIIIIIILINSQFK